MMTPEARTQRAAAIARFRLNEARRKERLVNALRAPRRRTLRRAYPKQPYFACTGEQIRELVLKGWRVNSPSFGIRVLPR